MHIFKSSNSTAEHLASCRREAVVPPWFAPMKEMPAGWCLGFWSAVEGSSGFKNPFGLQEKEIKGEIWRKIGGHIGGEICREKNGSGIEEEAAAKIVELKKKQWLK
ncbi:hypothetical protein ACH5RR_032612 [Cinchona calisaya]|uniref:Uncharacterized protein n=1 Tax=Cinchona calisaya TaxID=153742 RepID=A0ABD2YIL2_9GENT